MNHIDFSNLGGLPLTQERLDFLQQSYLSAFSGVAKLCGNKTILNGVVSDGVNVTDGWISYNNELIPFIGGSFAADVVITDTPVAFTFGDATVHDVQFTKVATCGLTGAFPFADLITLLSLQNIWLPGDLKEKIFVDGATADAYIAANFAAGIGINEQRGWAIVTTIYPATAGKVMVPVDAADANLDQVGKIFGAKTHTLAGNEQGSITAAAMVDDIGGGVASVIARIRINGTEVPRDGAGNQGGWGSNAVIAAAAAANGHNNMQPTYAILKLVKL